MRTVKFSLLYLMLLTSCEKPNPDFTMIGKSADGLRVATIQGFEPRGTIEGYILVSFDREKNEGPEALFSHIENGEMGWVSKDTFAVVADKVQFKSLSSDYYPDGTTDTAVKMVVCDKGAMNCSNLLTRLEQSPETRKITHFPKR